MVNGVEKKSSFIYVDEIAYGMVRGWLFDSFNPSVPRPIDFYIDEEKIGTVEHFISRKDVEKAGLAGEFVGFELQIPGLFLDGHDHNISAKFGDEDKIIFAVNGEDYSYINYNQKFIPKIISHVDGMREGRILGWVLKASETGEWEGNVTLSVYFNGRKVSQIRANKSRFDVGKTFSADHKCGFEYSPTKDIIALGGGSFSFEVSEYNVSLDGSPVKISFFSDFEESFILNLSNEIDNLSRKIEKIRRKMKFLAPKDRYDLSNYDGWYKIYNDNLESRYSRKKYGGTDQPLVSVVCPVYKPELSHFKMAVESIRAQVYENLEIIFVDDGSKRKDIDDYFSYLLSIDDRVQVIKNRKNLGISASTNKAISKSSGEWVAFFDHDDVLHKLAIDIMMRSVDRNKGAKLIYSDEDKIDSDGVHSEPALKSNFNYRLLLSVNYICHFVMVKRDVLDVVGGLNTEVDGAQDHDFLLRVTEHVEQNEIVHVPEILYHWRKSENSTAFQIEAKTYAVDAGIACVERHLKRRKIKATVKNINSSTWYSVFPHSNNNPSVSIVIPFKDQIVTTKKCVDCIMERTHYENYEIILANNWSTSTEYKSFLKDVEKLKNTKIIDIEEDFNYSRINNIGVENSKADYIVLMNNDLFVIDEFWLERMLGEFELQDDVGIVGGRFFYPNETIQHAGVVLGVGGVACHAFAGLKRDDPGYGARAILSQEISAVTAACLVIKKSVFDEVNGLDEKDLAVAFNDVDLCMKVRAKGYRVIYNAEFIADHHESLSRGEDDIDPIKETRFFHEKMTMIERWGKSLEDDPFYPWYFDKTIGRTYFDLLSPEDLPKEDRITSRKSRRNI